MFVCVCAALCTARRDENSTGKKEENHPRGIFTLQFEWADAGWDGDDVFSLVFGLRFYIPAEEKKNPLTIHNSSSRANE